MSALAETDPSDLPVGEMTGLTSWYSDDALRESLAAEFERAVSASPEDPRLLAQAAAAMRSLGELERSLGCMPRSANCPDRRSASMGSCCRR